MQGNLHKSSLRFGNEIINPNADMYLSSNRISEGKEFLSEMRERVLCTTSRIEMSALVRDLIKVIG